GISIADLTAPTPAPSPVAITGADDGSATELAWSADNRHLAILATTNHGTPAVFVTTDGATATRLASVAGALHDIRWSPDGTRIAGLYSSPDEQANSPVAATPRDTGVMDTHVDKQHLAV